MKKGLPYYSLLLLSTLFISSCYYGKYKKFEPEIDQQTGVLRFTMHTDHVIPATLSTRRARLSQRITREVASTGFERYEVYDRLILRNETFVPSETVYWLVDTKVFNIPIQVHSTSTEREEILSSTNTASGTRVQIDHEVEVTYRITYYLTAEQAKSIINSEDILVRYSSGPDRLTFDYTSIKRDELENLITTTTEQD
ncbi:MAG: hypothetical protein JJ975_05535 [Bacteroidia bacterium]|nr:hypothetical protein [Bacteroidia bacterium]